jgi:hypothetical protein
MCYNNLIGGKMINQGNNVPDKTIAVFCDPSSNLKNFERVENIITKSPKKRDWFSPTFYRCLPLAIGNQYGFVLKSEFDFGFVWNGEESTDAITFYFNESEEDLSKKYPRIESHFGHGIITINPPFTFRTPPGVNLMTINPPNFVIPNITVMTGVIETDHLRRNFTFNLKIQMPNIQVHIPAGTPLAAFMPIPRYYSDSFDLVSAEKIFDDDTIIEEFQAMDDANTYRSEIESTLPLRAGRHYFRGEDVYGNTFPDHQKP